MPFYIPQWPDESPTVWVTTAMPECFLPFYFGALLELCEAENIITDMIADPSWTDRTIEDDIAIGFFIVLWLLPVISDTDPYATP